MAPRMGLALNAEPYALTVQPRARRRLLGERMAPRADLISNLTPCANPEPFTITAGGGLLEERVAPRAGLPPLLVPLADRPPEALQWLGASFGLTQPLFNFWSRGGYAPVYLRQTASDITGARLRMRVECFHQS